MKLRIVNVVGARPNFVKMAPLLAAFRARSDRFETELIHTGQHYDDALSRQFFAQLDLPEPDANLHIGSGSHAEQTARVMLALEPLLIADRPDLVLVVGDVNSTLGAALTAAKLHIPVAHVEAGLRSFDFTMPEELNRRLTDAVSDYCFTTCADANENLRREGVPTERIHLVGNVMIDSLRRLLPLAQRSDIRTRLGVTGPFGVVTLHRPGNVDDRATLVGIIGALETIHCELPLVFPVHPRTAARLRELGISPRLRTIEPVGYVESLCLLANATVVLTDSGGVQEETTALGVPCLTLRDNTERPVTVTEGTNTLVGRDPARIVAAARRVLAGGGKRGHVPAWWDGHAAERIVEWLANHPPQR